MGLMNWLRSLSGRVRERPKSFATFDDNGASCRWPDGTIESVAWDDLRSIEIRTTDAGPFVEDVFLVLTAIDGGCVIPQEAEGFTELLEHVQQWPGFDHQAVISAMSCADNASFPCWRRGDTQPA